MNRALNYDTFNTNIEVFANTNPIASSTPYLIVTSLTQRKTYILEKITGTGKWKLKFTWACSIGKPSTPTPQGIFDVIGRRPNFGSETYQVRYATRFKEGYYYHSILYDGYGEKVINPTLGTAISNGCIRLATQNAKWIYDNIPDGTIVVIH